MKEALSQLTLDCIEIHIPILDCDIDIGSDSPIPTHQGLPLSNQAININ